MVDVVKNIRLTYVLTFLSECYWPSVAFLFFYLRYFTFVEIATLTAIQALATNLLEIPTGAFADMVGRKKSIILSFLVGGTALFIFPFVTAFWVFALLEIMKGLSNALYSGSMEALVYDSMKENGQEDQYGRVAGRMETTMWSSWFVSAILGGYLYEWNFQSPWILQGLMYFGAVLVAWQLVEPRLDSVKVNIRLAIAQNMQGLRELFATRRTARITLQLAAIGAGYWIAAQILGVSQAREYGMGPKEVSWLWGAGSLLSIIVSWNFVRLRSLFGEKRLIMIAATMMVISFVFAKYVGLAAGVALVLMRFASSSTFRNARSVVVNTWISSKNRATALSTLNLLTQAPYILLAPLFGAVIDKTSPNQFAWFLGVGIMLLVGSVQVLYVGRAIKTK